ncbi:type II toxin-antitoxin system PemK/MazF family toxin [Thermoanaerobacterium thermosaccharolyticum]|uniref:type II toxin-antitoxin system PemK/MazF family toxin n=1 Tax=Thermoanaerobacterium thermosaccharolyticum TaxID=1517 RepID=UPI0002E0B296|nr:type II toxin-antitoxin system PemK/MazF family toxin [Thermoanaerobacterium thermosaccharolyticum]
MQYTKLYSKIPDGVGNLTQDSAALIDQVGVMDVRRVKLYIGEVSSETLKDVKRLLIELIEEC